MLEDIQQGTGVAPGSCMSLEAQLGCGWENGCWNDLLGGTGVARGIWWHGDGTWRSQHGDGTGVAPGVCTPSVIQGWHVARGGTRGLHLLGGTGVAQGWLCPGAPSSTLQQGWHLQRRKRAAGGCVTSRPVCFLPFLSSVPHCSRTSPCGGRLCTPWDTGDAALCPQEGAAEGCAYR